MGRRLGSESKSNVMKSKRGSGLQAVVQRGDAPGTILTPHIYADGCYVVSKSRYEKHYVRVRSIEEVRKYLGRGYSLRMSNQSQPAHRSPSLISPASITGWR
jgi:hypothetical protein